MKKTILNQLAAIGSLVVLSVMVVSCGGGGSLYGGGSAPMTQSTVHVVACPASGTTDVSIVNMTTGFSPASIAVPVNTTVKWTNNDTTTHTVVSSTVPLYGTFNVQVNPGSSVCLQFTSAGTFNYYCSLHPTMPTGMVVVQ